MQPAGASYSLGSGRPITSTRGQSPLVRGAHRTPLTNQQCCIMPSTPSLWVWGQLIHCCHTQGPSTISSYCASLLQTGSGCSYLGPSTWQTYMHTYITYTHITADKTAPTNSFKVWFANPCVHHTFVGAEWLEYHTNQSSHTSRHPHLLSESHNNLLLLLLTHIGDQGRGGRGTNCCSKSACSSLNHFGNGLEKVTNDEVHTQAQLSASHH